MNYRFRINQDFGRFPSEKMKAFKDVPVANLGDVMNRMACVSGNMKPINQHALLGSAYTVKVADGDNLMLYYAIDNAQAGDVIVVDGGDYAYRALCGEIMISYAQARGIAGFVVNGAIRDADVLSQMDIPVYYCHISPNGPYKNGPGEVNYPITIQDQIVNPGDLVVGDGDGLIFIPQSQANDILREVKEIQTSETDKLKSIHENGTLDVSWLYKKLDELKVDY